MQKPKILYFLSHPIQYFSPLLKSISETNDLKVFFYSSAGLDSTFDKGFNTKIAWDIPLLEGYNYEFIKNYRGKKAINNGFFDVFNPGVVRVIAKTKAKIIIINGWTYSSNWMVLLAAKLFGIKVWLRAENPLNQESQKNGVKQWLKKLILKNLVFGFLVDKCLYIGSQSRLFFEEFGVGGDRLIYTPYSVDNTHFQSEYHRLQPFRAQIKSELGIPLDNKVVLFSGKLIPKKRPMDLLLAFQDLNMQNVSLFFVGDGKLKGDLENYISKNNISNVWITGFVNQSEITKYYSVSDCFVMCSGIGETWGLSVNEAMNFKLPVIVSNTCGSSFDLVINGLNGYTYDEGDIVDLRNKLRKVINDEVFRTSAGQESLKLVNQFSIQTICLNLKQAIAK